MDTCPELGVLVSRTWSTDVSVHVASCGSCKLVMELIDERSQAAASRDRKAQCARFEGLLAVRVVGGIGTTAAGMLDEHLEVCDECRAMAETLAPAADRSEDQTTLATIERSAYTLGLEVARGGMGRIVSARDLRIGRPVAVKELLAKTATHAARFEREARVTARLQHPGIVPIYEIGRWANGTPFYSMRMVEGRTLRAALADRKTVAQRLALLPAVIKACEAVAFAHANQVIHRDVTPANIMVGDYGETVVIDWGLAKDLADDAPDDVIDAGPYRSEPRSAQDLTVDGAVIGTAAYMPPEQAAGERVDARADVYALGAILYHVLAGHAPYRGNNDAVLAAVTSAPPPAITAPGAPRDLVSIVEKAMARDPAGRYASAGELAAELVAFQAGRLVEAHRYSRGELVRRWMRRHRAAVVVSMVASAVLVSGGVLAVAKILGERDRAEAGERAALSERAHSQHEATALLVEFGRQRLLAGEFPQAAAYLSAAYTSGESGPELRFLLGTAMSSVDAIERVLVGAKEPVQALLLSPDRTHLLVIRASTVEQWLVADGKRLPSLAAAHVVASRYSPDGHSIITASDDGTVRIWDAATGEARRTLAIPGTRHVALSDDGARVLTADAAGLTRTWNTATGALLETASLGPVSLVIVKGRYIVGASADPNPNRAVVRDWQAGTQFEFAPTWKGDGDLTDDGTRVLICGGTDVGVWDNHAHLVHHWQLPAGHATVGCRFDDTQRRVMAEDAGGTARIWDVATGAQLGEVSLGNGTRLAHLVGDRIISGVRTADVSVLDAATGTVVATYPASPAFPMNPWDGFVAAGEKLVLPRTDGSIAIVNLAGGRWMRRYVASEHPDETMIDISDAILLTAMEHDRVRVRDVRDGRVLANLGAPVTVTDDAAKYAGMTTDRQLTVFDTRTSAATAVLELAEHPDKISLDHSGRRLLVLRHGGPIETWDLTTHKLVASHPAAPADSQVGIQPDGRQLFVAQLPGRETFENLDGTEPHVVAEKLFTSLLSRDGKRVVATDAVTDPVTHQERPVIRVFDVATGQRLLEVDDGTLQTALDGDGDVLATLATDKIEIWSVSKKTLLRTISGFVGSGVALNADGTLVVTNRGVWSATDGRQLASTVTPLSVRALSNTSIASSDAFAVSFAQDPHADIALWGLPTETRPPAEIERILAERSPWRLERGELVER
jgi:WD40 repeat protein